MHHSLNVKPALLDELRHRLQQLDRTGLRTRMLDYWDLPSGAFATVAKLCALADSGLRRFNAYMFIRFRHGDGALGNSVWQRVLGEAAAEQPPKYIVLNPPGEK